MKRPRLGDGHPDDPTALGHISAAESTLYLAGSTVPPTSSTSPDIPQYTLGVSPLCPCGEKLICVSCHGHQRDHDDTSLPISESAGRGSPQLRPRKRARLEDGDQPPRHSRDAELEVPSGTTSASEQPVTPEDLDRLMIGLSQMLRSISLRFTESQAISSPTLKHILNLRQSTTHDQDTLGQPPGYKHQYFAAHVGYCHRSFYGTKVAVRRYVLKAVLNV
ncbi:hypothetical protein B0T18DRAFT_415208 [Schizothecium vesticola]|uniref:Uncharacterized protein n=1 Tax=Schizothecium vesticola TaxID=314040 RepID=A0AA40EQ59_9PEZI|nr:hypothetical protein B0T18DRAFT_415208 [Schizothecium vesticola]